MILLQFQLILLHGVCPEISLLALQLLLNRITLVPLHIGLLEFLRALLLHEIHPLVDLIAVAAFVSLYVMVAWKFLEDFKGDAIEIVEMEEA